MTVLVATGLAGSLILAGTVLATLTGRWRRALLFGAAGQLAVYVALVSGSRDIRLAVWNGAVMIVVILALALATASHDARRLGWILLALGLAAAGLVVQRAGLTAGLLNHNDVCHVLQAAALWPFYRAGLRLRDRSHQGSTGAQRAGGRTGYEGPRAERSVVSVKIEPSGMDILTTPAEATTTRARTNDRPAGMIPPRGRAGAEVP